MDQLTANKIELNHFFGYQLFKTFRIKLFEVAFAPISEFKENQNKNSKRIRLILNSAKLQCINSKIGLKDIYFQVFLAT
jgi:hypothetical protein